MLFVAAGVVPTIAHADEIRATAALAVARDPSGQKAAATAAALLRERVKAAAGLRLIDPERLLSGDPRTREEETVERARVALADGRRAYDRMALDYSIARLGQAVELYEQAGPLLGDLDELATSLAYKAAALILRGSADEGESIFVELLTISPNYQLADFPGTVRRIFDRAIRRIDRAPAGSVEIYSTPPHAAVFMDGRYEGVTPLTLDDLVAGTHYLRIEKLGYEVHGAPLEVAQNQQITSQTRLRSIRRGVELRDLAARGARDIDRRADRRGMGGALRTITRNLNARRIIFIAVSQSGRDASFTGVVFDGPSQRRMATRRTVLAVDREIFERDLGRYLDRLVAAASADLTGTADIDEPPPAGARDEPSDGAFGLAGPRSDRPGAREAPIDREAPSGSQRLGSDFEAPTRPEKETPIGTYVGWSLVGAGAATLITGGVFGVLALDTQSEFNDTPQNSPDVSDLQDTGNQQALVADVLYGVGGAMLVAGVTTLLVIELSEPSPSQLFEVEQAGLTPIDGGAVVSVGGSF